MSYWSSNWDKPWRDVKRFGEDIYNSANSWYNQNKQYLPNNSTAARSLGFGTHGFGIRGLINWGQDQFNRKWNNSHGAERYWMSQFPGYGWGKQLEGMANWYEDYYQHTGIDPKYPQVYGGGSGGLLGSLNSQVNAAGSPARWARSIEEMFPVKFQENLSRTEAFNKGYW